MKCRYWMAAGALLLGLSHAAQAAPLARALVYIDPQEYNHDIKLWHFYYSYWFSQGKAVEPLALAAFKPMFAEVGMCEQNVAADVVIWLRPRMFYNPHMTMFYGSIVAQVYSGSGKPLASYEANAEHNGFLDVVPAAQVKTTYQAAMQDIVRQMQADSALQSAIAAGLPASETPMPCGMVTILPAAAK